MKMNPDKCTFSVTAGQFLGFLIHECGIEQEGTAKADWEDQLYKEIHSKPFSQTGSIHAVGQDATQRRIHTGAELVIGVRQLEEIPNIASHDGSSPTRSTFLHIPVSR